MSTPHLQTIVIQLGIGCPLRCEHCYVSASPKFTQVLPLEQIEKIVLGYANFDGYILPYQAPSGLEVNKSTKALALTGGEPFYEGKLRTATLHAFKLALREGIFVAINTSGYFGKTLEKSLEVLSDFKGLGLLEISIDDYHERFVSLECVENCLIAAKRLGIVTQLALQKNEWSYRKKNNQNLLNLADNIYLQDFTSSGERNKTPKVKLGANPGGCGKVGNITFDEYGEAYPCSSATAMARRGDNGKGIPSFSLGSISNNTFESIVCKLQNSVSLSKLKDHGPITISNTISISKNRISCATGEYCETCINLHCSGDIKTIEQEPHSKLYRIAENLGGE